MPSAYWLQQGGGVGYLGEFEQLILFSVLQLGEGAYGVAIREIIEERTGRVVSSGAIYATIQAMAGGSIPELTRLAEG